MELARLLILAEQKWIPGSQQVLTTGGSSPATRRGVLAQVLKDPRTGTATRKITIKLSLHRFSTLENSASNPHLCTIYGPMGAHHIV